jgi:hypothetical protein
VIEPVKNVDVGEGKGKPRTVTLQGGVAGILLDARGRRPFALPENDRERVEKLTQWNRAVDMYPSREAEAVGV